MGLDIPVHLPMKSERDEPGTKLSPLIDFADRNVRAP